VVHIATRMFYSVKKRFRVFLNLCVYVCSIKVPTRCTFYMYFYSSLFLALMFRVLLHPSSGEQLQPSAIGAYNGFGMWIHWSRYWLGHPYTFSMFLFLFILHCNVHSLHYSKFSFTEMFCCIKSTDRKGNTIPVKEWVLLLT
jgi:hypothetical protein